LTTLETEASIIEDRPRGVSRFWLILLAVFGLMGARLAGAGFGFLSQLMLARTFSAADVGIAFLAMSITTFGCLVITSGYHALAQTYLSRYRTFGRLTLVAAFLRMARRDMVRAAAVVLAASILLYFFAPVSPGIAKAILFGGIAALPLAAIRLNNGSALSQRRFALSYVPDLVGRPALLVVFIAAMVLLGNRNVDVLLIALVGITIIVAVAQAWLLGPDNAWARLPAKVSRDLSRYMRYRAVSTLIIMVVTTTTADLVVMLGGALLPPDEVALLGITVRLAALIGFFSAASQPFIVRDLATAMAQSATAEVNSLLLRVNLVGLSIMAGAVIFCALFGHFILSLYGEHYVGGYWPLLLFLVGQGFRTAGGTNIGLLQLGGHQLKSARLCVAAVVLLVVLAVVLVRPFGLMGVAFASVCAEAFWFVGLAYLTQKLEGRRGDIVGLLMSRNRITGA